MRGHQYDLEDPEAHVRQGLAHKLALLIIIDGLSAHGGQHDSEDDEHRQPQLPHEGGVVPTVDGLHHSFTLKGGGGMLLLISLCGQSIHFYEKNVIPINDNLKP
uniref:Uncharacterized protein n=1 Tax=Paramormyrops kingsleyae TaxID=1676925 RepID=A0A3B3QLN9_9TELE